MSESWRTNFETRSKLDRISLSIQDMSFNGKPIKGVLLDITGVLAESSAEGDGKAIPGSVEAVKKLASKGEMDCTSIETE